MSRNANTMFAMNPTNIDLPRSTFDRPHSLKTSFNVGAVIPFYLEEILPGDSFKVKSNRVIRMQTLLTPMMSNLYLDSYYFFVPNRLVWEHWKEFNGENTQSAWAPTTEYEVPVVTSPDDTGFTAGTIADYFGIPTNIPNLEVNALPLRAYALIMNEWFRDTSLQDPLLIPVDDATVEGVNTDNYITDCAKGGKPFIAGKFRDYFTSCLPAPQRGPDVSIPVAEAGQYAVVGNGNALAYTDGTNLKNLSSTVANSSVLQGRNSIGNSVGSTSVNSDFFSGGKLLGIATEDQLGDNLQNSGLIAISTGEAQAATINQLRLAFQIQKVYEKDARGGGRYIEILKSHFGVTSPDARLQRPEYLGGNRVPININQVIQQSGTLDSGTPQGTVVGQSLTVDSNYDFTKSFVEHGFVIGVCVARYDHTYQQGLERMWSRRSRFDYYWPAFAHIGEQAVLNKEIYAQGTAEDDEVFGYQEAWADYRYKPDRVTGEMRSNYAQSLDVWHLADDYDALPSLSSEWIQEDKNTVDRVLAVTSANANQLFMDCFIQATATRVMPLYSIPGLIDHF